MRHQRAAPSFTLEISGTHLLSSLLFCSQCVSSVWLNLDKLHKDDNKGNTFTLHFLIFLTSKGEIQSTTLTLHYIFCSLLFCLFLFFKVRRTLKYAKGDIEIFQIFPVLQQQSFILVTDSQNEKQRRLSSLIPTDTADEEEVSTSEYNAAATNAILSLSQLERTCCFTLLSLVLVKSLLLFPLK